MNKDPSNGLVQSKDNEVDQTLELTENQQDTDIPDINPRLQPFRFGGNDAISRRYHRMVPHSIGSGGTIVFTLNRMSAIDYDASFLTFGLQAGQASDLTNSVSSNNPFIQVPSLTATQLHDGSYLYTAGAQLQNASYCQYQGLPALAGVQSLIGEVRVYHDATLINHRREYGRTYLSSQMSGSYEAKELTGYMNGGNCHFNKLTQAIWDVPDGNSKSSRYIPLSNTPFAAPSINHTASTMSTCIDGTKAPVGGLVGNMYTFDFANYIRKPQGTSVFNDRRMHFLVPLSDLIAPHQRIYPAQTGPEIRIEIDFNPDQNGFSNEMLALTPSVDFSPSQAAHRAPVANRSAGYWEHKCLTEGAELMGIGEHSSFFRSANKETFVSPDVFFRSPSKTTRTDNGTEICGRIGFYRSNCLEFFDPEQRVKDITVYNPQIWGSYLKLPAAFQAKLNDDIEKGEYLFQLDSEQKNTILSTPGQPVDASQGMNLDGLKINSFLFSRHMSKSKIETLLQSDASAVANPRDFFQFMPSRLGVMQVFRAFESLTLRINNLPYNQQQNVAYPAETWLHNVSALGDFIIPYTLFDSFQDDIPRYITDSEKATPIGAIDEMIDGRICPVMPRLQYQFFPFQLPMNIGKSAVLVEGTGTTLERNKGPFNNMFGADILETFFDTTHVNVTINYPTHLLVSSSGSHFV